MIDSGRGSSEPHGVIAHIASSAPGERYDGAAILRSRPHPVGGEARLQLGVPDDALGFRPSTAVTYAVRIEEGDGTAHEYACDGVWLERVQTSWWFILADITRSD
jgi:hypothetical protein